MVHLAKVASALESLHFGYLDTLDLKMNTNRLTPSELLDEICDLIDRIENALEKEAAKGDITSFATAFFNCDQFCRNLDNLKKTLRSRLDKFEKKNLPALFEDKGLERIRIPDIARSCGPQLKYSVSTVDKEELMKWLRSENAGDLITETVNASTLTAFCTSLLLEEGKEPPAEAAKLTSYNKMSFTRYKPKVGAKTELVAKQDDDF